MKIGKPWRDYFFIVEPDGKVKARTYANRSKQRSHIANGKAPSPMTSTEAIITTAASEADQGTDVMTSDIPNGFVQTDLVCNDGERMIMKIKGQLPKMLTNMNTERYADHVVQGANVSVLHAELRKASYRMLPAWLLYLKNSERILMREDFKGMPIILASQIVLYEFNNRLIWHFDHIKLSHKDAK